VSCVPPAPRLETALNMPTVEKQVIPAGIKKKHGKRWNTRTQRRGSMIPTDKDDLGHWGSVCCCVVSMGRRGVGVLSWGALLTCTMRESREASRRPMRARRKEKEEGRKGRVKGSSQGGGNAQPKWENLYEGLKREERAMARQDRARKELL
jgi:hypothetical protein